jgi:hypothetical protein
LICSSGMLKVLVDANATNAPSIGKINGAIGLRTYPT